jgi:hypothetical protein
MRVCSSPTWRSPGAFPRPVRLRRAWGLAISHQVVGFWERRRPGPVEILGTEVAEVYWMHVLAIGRPRPVRKHGIPLSAGEVFRQARPAGPTGTSRAPATREVVSSLIANR